MVDAPDPRVDLVRGVVVVPEPVIEVEVGAVAALDDRFGSGRQEEPVAPGSYPLAGWAVAGERSAEGRARTVAALGQAIEVSGRDDAQRMLEQLVDHVGAVEIIGVDLRDRAATAVQLDRLAR